MPPVEVVPAFRALGIALALGLLVGVQRQRAEAIVAGVRTFAIATLLGTCAAILASALAATPSPDGAAPDAPAAAAGAVGAGLILAAGAIGVVALLILGNVIAVRKGEAHAGMSTEVAMLAMYAVGAMAWLAPLPVTAGVGVAIAVLLHAKAALHAFSARLGEKDVRAVLTFALITFVILPVVPDQTYGPYNVVNPHEAWRMVVLVVGMSLAGYIAVKVFGRDRGVVLAGLLGGVISSTATTASASRLTRSATRASDAHSDGADGAHPRRDLDNIAATIVMLATLVMYARVLVEIAVVAPAHFARLAPPIGAMALLTLALSLLIWLRARRAQATLPEPDNPAALRPAIVFGLLYAGVLFLAAAAEDRLGNAGLFAVAAISGLTDMDAITLTSARLVKDGGVGPGEAWRAIVIAAGANMVFKTILVGVMGTPRLFGRVALLYGVCLVAAIAMVLAWPG